MNKQKSNIGLVCDTCLPPKPTDEAFAGLGIGDHVKVVAGGERFWVLLTQIEGELRGTVANDLIKSATHGYVFGDLVGLERDDIIDIYKRD